jgi:hypothetical protein
VILVCTPAAGILLFLLRFIDLDQHLNDLKDLEKNGGQRFSKVVQ